MPSNGHRHGLEPQNRELWVGRMRYFLLAGEEGALAAVVKGPWQEMGGADLSSHVTEELSSLSAFVDSREILGKL